MNPNANQIQHPGIIESIEANTLFVKIQPQSACGNCHSKAFCNLSESTGKIIEVKVNPGHSYKIGQEVTVTLERSLGYRALLLGYLLPFVLLLATIIVAVQLTNNEGFAALLGVLIMIPYFAMLYRFRESIKRRFEFRIKN
jgi:sigma-E factor negative regulatory protein RseC